MPNAPDHRHARRDERDHAQRSRSHSLAANSGCAVVVSRQAEESIRRGHPWVFDASIVHLDLSPAAPGSITKIVSEGGETLGVGIFDPASPIALRVWGTGSDAALDADVFRARLERAVAIRHGLFSDGRTTAYRLLNGEGDRTPGFVIDRYADVAVLRIDGDAAKHLAPDLTRHLEAVLRGVGITTLLLRDSVKASAMAGKPARPGERRVHVSFGPPREKVEVREHDVPFVVDVVHGQKTGAFLDQRENRRRIGEVVARRKAAHQGVRVLNLFSYTGGFSLRAALAGGTVTSLDVAAPAHATAQESFKRAGLDPSEHAFVTADAFAWLASAKRRGQTFDVVISDPPSFAPSERAKPKAMSAYRALHRACVDVLAADGHFVAASCSSHIGSEDFLATLDDASLGRSDLRLQDLFGPPPDHPTLPTFFEGRYLKLAILA